MVSTARPTAAAMILGALLLAAAPAPRAEAAVPVSTCAAIGGAQSEPLAEKVVLGLMRSRGTVHLGPRRVKVGGPSFAPVYANAEVWVSNPRLLNITCATSAFSLRVDVRATVSGGPVNLTRHGTAGVRGSYAILSAPRRLCPRNVSMPYLNLVDVPPKVDGAIRAQINASSLVRIPCQRF